MTNRNVNARLTYLGASVESSLYRNGKVFTQRDREGNDGAYHGVVTEQRDIVINDARRLDQSRRRQIEVHWFELLQRTLQRPDLQFLDNRQVVQEYYPECVPRSYEKPQMRHRPLRSIAISAGPRKGGWSAGTETDSCRAWRLHPPERTAAAARPGESTRRQ